LCAPARASHLLLLMIPCTPTSTLFPYSTLFRSWEWVARAAAKIPGPELVVLRLSYQAGVLPETPLPIGAARSDLAEDDRASAEQDRKSTRLNSSHVSTSYAVFCLKKTKTQQIST